MKLEKLEELYKKDEVVLKLDKDIIKSLIVICKMEKEVADKELAIVEKLQSFSDEMGNVQEFIEENYDKEVDKITRYKMGIAEEREFLVLDIINKLVEAE